MFKESITLSILKLGWRFWNGSIMGNVKVPHSKISILAWKLKELLIFWTPKTHISPTVPKETSCLLQIVKIKKMLGKVIFFAWLAAQMFVLNKLSYLQTNMQTNKQTNKLTELELLSGNWQCQLLSYPYYDNESLVGLRFAITSLVWCEGYYTLSQISATRKHTHSHISHQWD